MKVWDLHCDTLSALQRAANAGSPISFENNDLMIDLNKLEKGDYLLQCFACFVNLERTYEDPLQSCLQMIDVYYELLKKYPDRVMQVKSPEDIKELAGSGKIGAMLTVEEGAVCRDDIRVLRNLYRLGVRMMTLTWNHENGLAYPNNVPGDGVAQLWPCAPVADKGLKQKGIEFLEEMEDLHMILDVSHLSDGGFWDVVKYSKRPFAASHSSSREVCGHVRNLTDDMIRAMAERGGLIGLNYCASFLDPNPNRDNVKSRISDMVIHARHMVDVGGEDILALGSDFDGIEGDLEIKGAGDMQLLAEALLKNGFSERLVEKIFYKNAERFYMENL